MLGPRNKNWRRRGGGDNPVTRPLRFGSVCSGIEGASEAWYPLGMQCAWTAEIEPFPAAVIAERWGHKNYGDFRNIGADAEPIDLLVGGTPCQDFSVAGLRAGMAGDRGNLTLEFLRLAQRTRPRWVVWENVPGVLSSNNGRDFGTFLRGLGELGYGFAYRILDAQHFGVPQRRRRVFVVGYFGDWRVAAAVLFERHSLSGNPAPSRKAGQGTSTPTAPILTGSGRGVERTGESRGQDPVVASFRMQAFGEYDDDGSASAMKSRDFKDATDLIVSPLMSGSGRPAGHNARSGHCKDSHIVPAVAPCLTGNYGKQPDNSDTSAGPMLIPVGIDGGELGYALRSSASHSGDKGDGGVNTTMVATAFAQNQRDEVREMDVAGALASEPGMKQQTYIKNAMAVRRLTPRECERLQGFKDDYTLIKFRGKPAADGNRYKALGNSWAVPVVKWIGERIQQVDKSHLRDQSEPTPTAEGHKQSSPASDGQERVPERKETHAD